MGWMMDQSGANATPSTIGLLVALGLVMAMSIASAVSGVGKGVKILSDLNLILSLILLAVFVIFGSFAFALTTYGSALADYLLNFLQLSFGAFGPPSAAAFQAAIPTDLGLSPDDMAAVYSGATNAYGSLAGFTNGLPEAAKALPPETLAALYAAGTEGRLFGWQASWTTFYWAWWIAFSPFVGLFLARISKGRSVREFILGAVIAPSLVCFAWMAILGGSAIALELDGTAQGAIISATNSAKLFTTLSFMLDGWMLQSVVVMCVVLILTFLVTSADSGILVMNTIMSGGTEETGLLHRIIWGVILTLVIATLLIAGGGGLSALQNTMIIGALPFAMIMVMMCLSLAKAFYNDGRRDKAERILSEATSAT